MRLPTSQTDPVVMHFKCDEQDYKITLYPDQPPGYGLTPREGKLVHSIADVRGVRIWEALNDFDPLTFTALLVIAGSRAGQKLDLEKLLDGVIPFQIIGEAADGEDAPLPPAAAEPDGASNGSAEAPSNHTTTTLEHGGVPD